MPRQVRAVVVDPSVGGGLAIREIGLRDPDRDEAGVRAIEIRSDPDRQGRVKVKIMDTILHVVRDMLVLMA